MEIIIEQHWWREDDNSKNDNDEYSNVQDYVDVNDYVTNEENNGQVISNG